MLQSNYIIIDKGIKGAADPLRSKGQIMKKRDFLEDFIYYQFLELEEEERKTNPGAFLLTEKESKLLSKAAVCIQQAGAPLLDVAEKTQNPELLKVIINDTFKAFENEKLNIKKLRSLAIKFTTALFWSITPEFSQQIDINGVIVTTDPLIYKITVSTQEQLRDITLDDKHPFFKAETMQARAQALGLSDLYLYVARFDLGILEVLSMMFTLYDKGQVGTPAEQQKTTRLLVGISSPITNAFNNIGAGARAAQEITKRDERGRQITIFECSDINGIDISISSYPEENITLLSVGDPNADKLLKQAQIETVKTGKQKMKIPFNDFMKFRGLSDRKTAMEKADTATDIIDRARYRYYDKTDNSINKKYIHYVQSCELKVNPGRAGSYIEFEWSNEVYSHLISLADSGQQIIKFDSRIMELPDNQRTAYNIANRMEEHTRSNAGKKNAHVLSVRKLISCCSILPLYPESAEESGKENYLRFPSEAPQRIIKPFIKGLDFITKGKQSIENYQILERYTFKHKKGGVLTDAELSEALKDYKKFIELNIEWRFTAEPDYSYLIERRSMQLEKAESKKNKKQK